MVGLSLAIPLPPREGGAERQTEQVLLNRQTRNSFLRFRAGLKGTLRQYIKSDFDLF